MIFFMLCKLILGVFYGTGSSVSLVLKLSHHYTGCKACLTLLFPIIRTNYWTAGNVMIVFLTKEIIRLLSISKFEVHTVRERKFNKVERSLWWIQALYVGCGADISASFGIVWHDLQMSPQLEDEQEESGHRHSEENEVEDKGSE